MQKMLLIKRSRLVRAFTVCAASLALGLMCSDVAAAPILYNETTDGDLPGEGAPLTTFTFDIGNNIISGISGNTTIVEFNIDFDSFAFIVPVGTEVVFAEVTASDSTGDVTDLGWRLNSGSADWFTGTFLGLFFTFSPGSGLVSPVTLGAGTYNVSAGSVGSSGNPPASADYTFTFLLEPVAVPEPGTLTLVGLGAIGLVAGAMRRRLKVAA